MSYLLYGNYEYRQSGDIDIFVPQADYGQALNLLIEEGFRITEKEGYGDDHHIVLVCGNIVIELHKCIIAPECEIDERYLLEHTMLIDGIKTLDVTATFLHLIYHFYTDTFTTTDMYSLYVLQLYPKRFLLREYELVLFAEKYMTEIKWEDIISDIKKADLRITFKYMFDDIIRIFPGMLPKELIKVVDSLEYYEKEEDVAITNILAGKFSYEKEHISMNLSRFIEENWNPYEEDLNRRLGSIFFIADKTKKENLVDNECECTFRVDRYEKGICLSCEVKDDDFSFADTTFPNVHRSDGIQLFMCGTQRYSYKNIFMFPRFNDGNYEVIPYDVVKRRMIKRQMIETKLEVLNDRYRMHIYLTDRFLNVNYMCKYFYFNVVLCDCDSKTQKRRKTLNLIRQSENWYNPLYFVKFDCCNL